MKREDAKAHDILLCIQTGKTINDEDRMKFNTNEVYFKSADEMKELFKNIPEAIENTVKVAQMCNVELEFNKLHLPEFAVSDNTDPFIYLSTLCFEGLNKRYGMNHSEDKTQRLEYELKVIKQMGYVDYFLIDGISSNTQRTAEKCRTRRLCCRKYCFILSWNYNLTRLDLIFCCKIWNPERISCLIRFDFASKKTGVIDYVIDKNGKDRVHRYHVRYNAARGASETLEEYWIYSIMLLMQLPK